ncbi:MAG: hypothetical protein JWQ02_3854 [Capsulimonas sp.]|nr:hypothetical protein [Capsulimonas sp.]
MDLWNTIKQYISSTQTDNAFVTALPHNADARQAIDAYLQEAQGRSYWNLKAQELEAGRTILSADPSFQIAVLLTALTVTTALLSPEDRPLVYRLRPLVSALTRRALPYTDSDLLRLAQAAPNADCRAQPAIVRILMERLGDDGELSAPMRDALETWSENMDEATADAAKLHMQLHDLLAGTKRAPVLSGEPWGDSVLDNLAGMTAAERAQWNALLTHAMAADAAKPSAKWLNQARPLVEAIGQDAFLERLKAWTALFTAHHLPPNHEPEGAYERYLEWTRLSTLLNHNYSALKGLAWGCRLIENDARIPALLGDLADHALRKIPGHGPKSAKIGNACISSLGAMSGMAAVAQLSRLKRKVKYVASQGMIETALAEAAQRAGLPAEDLEELATPTFDLDESGQRREELGEYFAELALTSAGHVELMWSDRDGKVLKSVPAEVKKNHAETLKELKQSADEMGKMLPALRDRLEGLLLADRSWKVTDWRERYIEHPVMGTMAHRLIWSFTDGERSMLGMWRNGEIVNEIGQTLPSISKDAVVRLWHPLGADPQTVLAWRQWLETHEVRQPFKQAHREIYVLTDAEIATATYSNRFAAHIIRQHQFQALCRERGWRYQLQGGFDGANTPTLNLPKHGLRAEFWVEGGEGHAMSASYIDLYVSTDQVRFYNDQGTLLPLADVPPLLFSEIMRDVDLFVGVCSIGNDPNWRNNDGVRNYDAYWTGYSFGDLTATAQTRRDVLSRLLPRLKIANQCTLEGKFLHVRGELRAYKIHLGSGNILMEPNDQYLCIVPDRKKDAKADATNVFLPFEGDQTLAVIFSKAFLLAEDDQIKDATILRQIRS